MTEHELRTLIREVIGELIRPPQLRVLVVFTGGLLGFDEAIDSLAALKATGAQLDYRQTPSAERILDQRRIQALGMREVSKQYVESHDMLILPTMTGNIAAQVAHGIADCLVSNLASEFIMSNRIVVASRTAVRPDGAEKLGWFPHMPPGYADLLRANLAALSSFGVRVVDAKALCRTAIAAWQRADRARRSPLVEALGTSPSAFAAQLDSDEPDQPGSVQVTSAEAPQPAALPSGAVACPLSLISQQVVQQLPSGIELRIGRTAKVTAMALDLAGARSIRISREV
ncbi:MAG: hypothetical protein IPL41_00460 [Micropruina sp.]|nr:hypothetical protein [Micropruina sp.]